MNYLELYKKWAETGRMENRPDANGDGGLCNTVIPRSALEIFVPDYSDAENIPICNVYWAALTDDFTWRTWYKFNEFRQNIVLLLAAMEDQL